MINEFNTKKPERLNCFNFPIDLNKENRFRTKAGQGMSRQVQNTLQNR